MDMIMGGIRFRISPALRPDNEYSRRKRTDYIVVHCADTKAAWDGGAEEIREWHVEDNGWLDIGYHFVIRRDGTVENGRPVWAVGSGVRGHNAYSLHICLVGGRGEDGEPEDNFTINQKTSLAFLIAMLKEYGFPNATVQGHRDFPATGKACPSFDVKPWWEERRRFATEAVKKLAGFRGASQVLN